MTERTYQADTMANVLGEVKHDLGRDAVILRTRSYRKGGLLGLIGGRPMWEITACAASDLSGDDEQGQYVAQIPLERSREPLPDPMPPTPLPNWPPHRRVEATPRPVWPERLSTSNEWSAHCSAREITRAQPPPGCWENSTRTS